jgi:hypothetical protein
VSFADSHGGHGSAPSYPQVAREGMFARRVLDTGVTLPQQREPGERHRTAGRDPHVSFDPGGLANMGSGSVVHMAELVLPVAVLTGDDGALRAVEVCEVDGVLVEREGGVPVDLVSLVKVFGLDPVPV